MKAVISELNSELAKIRGKAWAEKCLEVSRCKYYSDLHKMVGIFDNANRWSEVKNKGLILSKHAIPLICEKLPGTANVFEYGLFGELPVWNILNREIDSLGNDDGLAECSKLVDGILNRHKPIRAGKTLHRSPPVSEMNLMDKCQALLEIITPANEWRRPEISDDAFELVDWTVDDRDLVYYTLPELLQFETNIISKSYTEFLTHQKGLKYFMALTLPDVIKLFEEKFGRKYVSPPKQIKDDFSNPEFVLALIALLQLFGNEKGKVMAQAHAYIKQGIDNLVLDTFGKEISLYVNSNL